jgi:D-2-hydroxyacid dehydrogenase (NADP+)
MTMLSGDEKMPVVTVLIVDRNAEGYAARLSELRRSIRLLPVEAPTEAALHFAEADVLLSFAEWLTPEITAAMRRLRWIQLLSAGVEHVLPTVASRPDVLITSMRGIHGPQMSEMVLVHMLTLSRQIPRLVRNQAAHAWEPFDQPLLHGRTVAIIGLGVAGQATARACKALGMRVHGVSRSPTCSAVDVLFDRSQLTEAAATADYLVITIPLSNDTEKLIDASVLAAMKPTAYLINVARGEIVDESALIHELESGGIAGAGLDVAAGHSLPRESSLWDMPNVFITPHIAGRSDQYVDQAIGVIRSNLRRFLAGDLSGMTNIVRR